MFLLRVNVLLKWMVAGDHGFWNGLVFLPFPFCSFVPSFSFPLSSLLLTSKLRSVPEDFALDLAPKELLGSLEGSCRPPYSLGDTGEPCPEPESRVVYDNGPPSDGRGKLLLKGSNDALPNVGLLRDDGVGRVGDSLSFSFRPSLLFSFFGVVVCEVDVS